MLVSAASATVLATLFDGQEFGVKNLLETVLTVGGPTALGQVIVYEIEDQSGSTKGDEVVRAVAGASAAITLMVMGGALPGIGDNGTLYLGGIIGVGIYIGETYAQ